MQNTIAPTCKKISNDLAKKKNPNESHHCNFDVIHIDRGHLLTWQGKKVVQIYPQPPLIHVVAFF